MLGRPLLIKAAATSIGSGLPSRHLGSAVFVFFLFRRKDKEDGAGSDVSPVAGSGAFGAGGEAVLVHADAEVGVGGEGGLTGGEEASDGGGAGAKLFDEFGEPTGELATFGGEGGFVCESSNGKYFFIMFRSSCS